MNYWFWLYIVIVPLIVFSVKPEAAVQQRIIKLLIVIAVCYALMNLAVCLKWDFIHAEVTAIANPTEDNLRRATADGANLIFTALLGWIPAATYVGWWEIIWRFFYRTRLKNNRDKGMLLSHIIIAFSMCFTLLGCIFFLFPFGYPLGFYTFLHVLLPPFMDVIAP